MGRWTQYDEDDYRLPEGMKRIGYDADSGCYYFLDSDGSYWMGEPGESFGEMSKVKDLPSALQAGNDEDVSHGADLEASPRRRNGDYELLTDEEYRPMANHPRVNVESFRALFPFFLIIAVVLLLVWRLVVAPELSAPAKKCPEGTSSHWIQPGENCWEISRQHNWTLEQFKQANPTVVCDPLMPGTSVCLPQTKKTSRRL